MYDGLNNIEEMLRQCGCININTDDNEECEIDYTAGADKNCCKNLNLDVPFGFQDIDPMLFTVIGEVISNIMTGKLPTNVANAFGNWLQLVGQVIFTFNAQQQYSQSGPGRYYNKAYKNIANPFCNNAATADGDEQLVAKKKGKKTSNSKDMKKIKATLSQLEEEVNKLKKQIGK